MKITVSPACFTIGCLAAWLLAAHRASAAPDPLMERMPVREMTLEELVNLRVTVGTLGGSELRRVPASVTVITSEDIEESGARNLNELLEIYVPDLLYLRQNWEATELGIRGVTGAEKFLLLVNGKLMNNHAHAGALAERDLRLLGDIKEIQVVRGPGSAVHGAGAVIGVIHIKTYDGTSFTGTQVTARAGRFEEFNSLEVKSGFNLGGRAHLFLYGGISDLSGADRADAPLVLALRGSTFRGTPIVPGEPFPDPLRPDQQGFRGQAQLKFFGELTIEDFSLWARYTRGGERLNLEQRWLIQWPEGFAYDEPLTFQRHEVGYQQISVGTDYRHRFSDHWELAGRAGFSTDDYVRREFDGLLDAHREDIYTARLLATWNSTVSHSLTFGFEYLHGEFGKPTLGYPGGPALSIAWSGIAPAPGGVSGLMPRWSTDTYSALAEDRWDISPEWSLFTDLRIDKNEFTDFMFSPRAALVHTPTKRDTFKLILSQAVKANVAEELKFQHDAGNGRGETETLRSAEFSYNRFIGEHFSIGASTFYNHFDIIGWDETQDRSTAVGELDFAGFELEARYRSGRFRAGFSHSYTRMVGFDAKTDSQFITAEPFGFGDDLNHWSSHISKLHFAYRPTGKLQFTGSLRVFWGWPGWKDYSDYENSAGPDDAGDPRTFIRDAGYNPYDKIQVRLNLGATYDVNDHVTAGIHGYNLLGLIDPHLNDRFIMFSSSAQREAVALAVTLSCRF